MTDAANVPGGDASNAGGEGEGKKDSVAYETYKRTVDAEKALKQQLKETSERLSAFEQQQKAAEEQKLLEQNQHLEVINNLKKQNEELVNRTKSFEQQQIESRKLTAAMGLLGQKGVQLDSKYLGLIPIDEIQVDADGRPDMASVVKVMDNFQKEHPRLVGTLPNDLPGSRTGGSGASLTVEQWSQLPYAEKQKRWKDVKQPTA